jgi:hypothetical protein
LSEGQGTVIHDRPAAFFIITGFAVAEGDILKIYNTFLLDEEDTLGSLTGLLMGLDGGLFGAETPDSDGLIQDNAGFGMDGVADFDDRVATEVRII